MASRSAHGPSIGCDWRTGGILGPSGAAAMTWRILAVRRAIPLTPFQFSQYVLCKANARNPEMKMSYAVILEQMKSTSYYLATALGDLRSRLPGAYAIGLGAIEVDELRHLHPALAARFEALIARFPAGDPARDDWGC